MVKSGWLNTVSKNILTNSFFKQVSLNRVPIAYQVFNSQEFQLHKARIEQKMWFFDCLRISYQKTLKVTDLLCGSVIAFNAPMDIMNSLKFLPSCLL